MNRRWYLWCNADNCWHSIVLVDTDPEPTECPDDPGHEIDAAKTYFRPTADAPG
jgi:hypothetical protein